MVLGLLYQESTNNFVSASKNELLVYEYKFTTNVR